MKEALQLMVRQDRLALSTDMWHNAHFSIQSDSRLPASGRLSLFSPASCQSRLPAWNLEFWVHMKLC